MKTLSKIIFTSAIIICISKIADAQNYNDVLRLSEPGIITGARSLGMGNAYVALSNDFSATLFNPAGLAFIKKTELTGGLNYNSFDNSAGFFNQSSNLSNSVSKFSQFGIVLPFPTVRGSFVLAFGYNQSKDFNKTLSFNAFNPGNNSYIQDLAYYNDDIAFKLALSYPLYDSKNNYLRDTTVIRGMLNQRGNIFQEGGLNSWSFSGAIEVEKDIFIGATVNFYNGIFKKTKDYFEEDKNNVYPSSVLLDPQETGSADFRSFYLRDIIDWNISSIGINLGALVKVDKNFNIAATTKLPKTFRIRETYFLYAESQFGTGSQFTYSPDDQRLEYNISTPPEYLLGASFLQDNITLSGSVTMIDYSKAKFDSGFDVISLGNKNADIQTLLRSVYNVNAGFEYVIPYAGVALRGGFMLMQSPFKNDPAEFDKKFVTVGLGYKLTKSISIDAAFAYGWWNDVGDNYSSELSRTYQNIKTQNLITSFKYLF